MKYFFLLPLLLFYSCQEKILNDASDIEKAKSLTEEFYQRIKDKDAGMICKNLDRNLDEKHFCRLLSVHIKEYADFKKKSIYNIETVRNGSNKSEVITYDIMLDVSYQKGKSYETLNFRKEKGSVKLVSYYFSPPKYR